MGLSNVQPITDHPILLAKEKKTIVLGDLHIGIESELKDLGVNAELQTKKMIKRIEDICKEYKPEHIILNGDIKHNIPVSTFQEMVDVENFFDTIKKLAKIHVIPGNHDGNISDLISEGVELHDSDGYVFENLGVIHGHSWPSEKVMNCDMVVMSHTHPTVMLTDRRGFKRYEPCWVKTSFYEEKLKEKYPKNKNPNVLIIPAFNPLCGGIAVNREGIVGPFGEVVKVNDAEIFLLDGTSLGKVKNIV